MRFLAFYVPLCYSMYTRFQGIRGIATWILKYGMLVLLASLIHKQDFCLIRFVLGVFFTYSLYEFGYIWNDAETIKKEAKPTMRLATADLSFYEQHKGDIFFVRICFSLLIGSLLFVYGTDWCLLIYSFLTIPVFGVYNRIRSKWNLHIHVVLMFLRLSIPIFMACNYVDIPLCLWIIFVYPLVVFIELSVKGKFGYRNLFFQKYLLAAYEKKQIHTFRVRYYIVFTLVMVFLSCMGIIATSYLYPTVYYYVFVLLSARKIAYE